METPVKRTTHMPLLLGFPTAPSPTRTPPNPQQLSTSHSLKMAVLTFEKVNLFSAIETGCPFGSSLPHVVLQTA